MKISVITVCLNSEKTIERTIKSLIGQTHNNIEYIVIDGNSKDNTVILLNLTLTTSTILFQKKMKVYIQL